MLGVLNDKGTKAYIAPIKIEESYNPFYKAYAKTSNFVTSGINTSKVLYTLYQKPEVVKTAIKTADTASKVKNTLASAVGSFFSFFK